jgi:aromatic ring-opening dioxygenase catalytic subunit (LigB family)
LKKIEEFEKWATSIVSQKNGRERTDELLKFSSHPVYRLAHPSDEHWLPLIYSTAAGEDRKLHEVECEHIEGISN